MPSDGVVVFVHMAFLAPLLEKQVIGLLRELLPRRPRPGSSQSEIDEIVHRPPDAAAPVVLIVEGRVVALDGGDDPLAPEFLGVEQVLIDHGPGLFRGGRVGQHGVEVGGRKAHVELAGVQVLVEEDAGLRVPESGEFGAIA